MRLAIPEFTADSQQKTQASAQLLRVLRESGRLAFSFKRSGRKTVHLSAVDGNGR
jgi:hypothetical protein